MRAPKATQQVGRRLSPALTGTLATSLVMVSTASDIYVALGERQFHARQLNRATGDEYMKPGQRGLQQLHYGRLGCMVLSAAARV